MNKVFNQVENIFWGAYFQWCFYQEAIEKKYAAKKEENFCSNEDGIGVVEIILILVVLVALIVIFRKQLTDIISNAFSQINGGADTINSEIKIK